MKNSSSDVNCSTYSCLKIGTLQIRNDEKVVFEAIQKNGGCCLEFVSDGLKKDTEVVPMAVKSQLGSCEPVLPVGNDDFTRGRELAVEAVNQLGKFSIYDCEEL